MNCVFIREGLEPSFVLRTQLRALHVLIPIYLFYIELKSLTPTNGKDECQASFLFKCVCQKSVKIVAFAEHPRVVCQSEVLGQHKKKLTTSSVLDDKKKPKMFIWNYSIRKLNNSKSLPPLELYLLENFRCREEEQHL